MASELPGLEARAKDEALSSAELSRYSRHLLLPEVGRVGQQRLKSARIVVVGAGGLGSPVSLYLAAAGVGTIGLVDDDRVDRTNLQRQVLYGERDVGRGKLEAAAERLRAANAEVEVVTHAVRLTPENAKEILGAYDLVVDGTDNFATRYLVNDCCVLLGKPYVYGSVFRFDGQAAVFWPGRGPCYRCLFPTPPAAGTVPNCAEGGVLGVLPGLVGMIQATEAVKLVVGAGESLLGRLLTIDALTMRFSELRLPRDPTCRGCGAGAKPIDLTAAASVCATRGARGDTDAQHGGKIMADSAVEGFEITVQDYEAMRRRGDKHLLVDVRGQSEADICKIDGARLIPLPELEQRLAELPRDVTLIVHCKAGARSAKAVELLRQRGYPRSRSLAGGILAWIDAYAPHLAKY